MAFQYKRRDPETFEKRAAGVRDNTGGIIHEDHKTYSPEKGDNFIRILPPTWEDATHYGLDVWVHYGLGTERQSALCISKMKNLKCPICEARARADRAGDEELAKELSPSRRVAVWLIDRKDESKGPMVWTMPGRLDEDICKLARDPRTGEVYYLDDPENGFDVSYEKTGEKVQTRYTGIQLARRASSVDQVFVDYVVEFPLPSILVWHTYEEIRKMYEGDDPPPEEPRREAPQERRQEAAGSAGGSGGGGASGWKPRGSAGRQTDAPRDPPPREEPKSARDDINDEVPWTRDRDEAADKMGAKQEQRRADPPPSDTSGMSRAEQLRAKFAKR